MVPNDDLDDCNNGIAQDSFDFPSQTPRSLVNDIMAIPGDSPREMRDNRVVAIPFGARQAETPRHSAFAFPATTPRPQLRRERTMTYESVSKDGGQDSSRNRDHTTKTSSATSSRYKTQGTSRSGSIDQEDDADDNDGAQLADLPANQQRFVILLDKMLAHKTIHETDLAEFTLEDFGLLRAIVHRKYKITLTNQDIKNLESTVNLLNKADKLQAESKRSEENNKLVFKRALKYLIHEYRKEHSKELRNLKKREYEALICKAYFSSIPLPEAKKPKSKKPVPETPKGALGKRGGGKKGDSTLKPEEKIRGFVINPNTINARYINFVFNSDDFKTFFYQFVERHFLADYGGSRINKLIKIVSHIYEKKQHGSLPAAQDYIEHNAKFKIPWSDHELKVAVKSACEFIARVQKKNQTSKAANNTRTKRNG